MSRCRVVAAIVVPGGTSFKEGEYVRSGPAPFLMMIMIGLDYLTSPYDPRQERGTLLSEFSGSVGIDPWGGFEGVW